MSKPLDPATTSADAQLRSPSCADPSASTLLSQDTAASDFSDFLYLASQSPRRSQLLQQIGVRHELLLADADEDAEALEAVLAGEAPDDYVQRVTMAKLEAALRRLRQRGLPQAPVLCADTTVAVDRHILGKPVDAADALEMLVAMSGREHRVLTAVAVGRLADTALQLQVSTVRFAAVDRAELRRYVATGEPMGKAGAYAIQGRAAAWIEHIAGSHSGIMGLPLFETACLLRRFKVRTDPASW